MIEDGDLWRWRIPGSREFYAGEPAPGEAGVGTGLYVLAPAQPVAAPLRMPHK